jgi:sigma-E factor negative regulatory protein RseA
MTDVVGESLSALQDGEANELDVRRVLKELGSSDELRERWSRYQLAASVLNNESPSLAGFNLADKIRQQLDDEPVAKVPAWRALFKPVASIAVAATVTMGVLTGTQLYQQAVSVDDALPATAEIAANASLPAVSAFDNFDNGTAPVTANQIPEYSQLSVLASSSDSQRRASRGIYSADSLFTAPARNTAQRPTEADILAEQQLNFYLQNHVEQSSFNTGVGLLPYARVGQPRER